MVYCYFTEKQMTHLHVSLNLITFRVIDFFPSTVESHLQIQRENTEL